MEQFIGTVIRVGLAWLAIEVVKTLFAYLLEQRKLGSWYFWDALRVIGLFLGIGFAFIHYAG